MLRIAVLPLTGRFAMTVDDGQIVHERILGPLLSGETVELDFQGVEICAPPFMNPAIGHLLEHLSEEAVRTRLRCINLTPQGERLLERILENAAEYFSLTPERRAAVDEILSRHPDDVLEQSGNDD